MPVDSRSTFEKVRVSLREQTVTLDREDARRLIINLQSLGILYLSTEPVYPDPPLSELPEKEKKKSA